jgi:pimeloyl-ACP methyl ester carboxylesterase
MSEETVILGEDRHLVATLTLPAHGMARPAALAAVLTNSGVISRFGPHRINVHLARRLAARGIPSVRFDMSGVGDSRRGEGALARASQWVRDTRTVMDFAQARTGCARFVMVGFCSGAEVAYQTALDDGRLRAVLLWDMYAYPTRQFAMRSALFRLRRAGLAGVLRKAAARARSLLRSQPGGTAGEPSERRIQAAAPQTLPPKDIFAADIQRLAGSGVQVHVMYCGGEPLWYNYRRQFDDAFARYRFPDSVTTERLEISDHLLTRQVAQQAFIREFERWLDARVLPAVEGPAPSTPRR